MRRVLCLSAFLFAMLPATSASAGVNPQVVGLQVALRAYGLYLVPIDGFFDGPTERALRRFQRARHLTIDGVAGTRTLAAFTHRAPQAVRPVLVRAITPATKVRALLDYWSARYGMSKKLVRAVAWME